LEIKDSDVKKIILKKASEKVKENMKKFPSTFLNPKGKNSYITVLLPVQNRSCSNAKKTKF
jgi:hypothetical protein